MSRGREYKALRLLGMWAVFARLLLHSTLSQQERGWREEENCMWFLWNGNWESVIKLLAQCYKEAVPRFKPSSASTSPLCCADQCPWHRSQEVCIHDDRRWGGHETRHPAEGQSWRFLVALKSRFICLEMWDFLFFFFCETFAPSDQI